MKFLVAAGLLLIGATLSALPQRTATHEIVERLQTNPRATPVNIVLHDGSTSYSVPAGKELRIEHLIWSLEADATHQRVTIRPDNVPGTVGSFQLKFESTAPDSWTPTTPIRLVGTGSISILKNTLVDWRDVLITGQLADA